MCGINGIFAYATRAGPVDEAELIASRDSMYARGPDGYGAWMSADGRVGLGHRRLAIIDLSPQGAQPMATPDGRLRVTFNGEIYNYRELRADLLARGIPLASQSDTEVLLHLYRLHGESMVSRLRGMFAFAIWDVDARALVLARDPYGIKPLYYADDGRSLRFASQVSALLAGKAVPRDLDPGGVTGFFLWGSVPEPITIYHAIRALPAGTTLRVDRGGVHPPTPYWSLGDAIVRACEQAAAIPPGHELARLRDALLDSVRHHLVADVPVGAFLSAGLDSSTVVGLAAEAGHKTLDTVTLAFEEFRNDPLDELPLAIETARHLGVPHRSLTARLEDLPAELPRFFAAMDQPTIDGINTWFVSEATSRAGLKVALSGLGGDELLGGYDTFRTIPTTVGRWAWAARLPGLGRASRRVLALLLARSQDPRRAGCVELGGTYPGAYRLARGLFMPWELPQLLDRDVARAGLERLRTNGLADDAVSSGPALSPFARLVHLESERYMRNQLLRDTDWVGMTHSLEIRVPLVDHVLTEAVVGLAAAHRLGEGKALLPLTLRNGLPDAVLRRRKTGFTVPIWRWLHRVPDLDIWKRHPVLKRPRTTPLRRWAYCVLHRFASPGHVLSA
jgi:asparagine synthase (glutamine-hydrolysing)